MSQGGSESRRDIAEDARIVKTSTSAVETGDLPFVSRRLNSGSLKMFWGGCNFHTL